MVIRRWGLLAALVAVIMAASAIGSVKAEADGDELVFIETGDSLAVRGFEARTDFRLKHRFRDGFSARIKPGLRKEMESLGFKIREVPVYHPSVLPDDPTPYGIEQIYSDPAIAATSGGAGITIGHLDTGVDISHPDLNDRIVGCKDATSSSGIVDGCDDWHGHGTHTAGSAVADGGPSGAGIYGVAPEADLYVVRTCTSDGCAADDIAAAINYLGGLEDSSGDPLIDIISMSIGGNKFSTLIADAIADNPGILFVAAAGNDGPASGSIDYPAWDPRVVAVGGINFNKVVADFSSRSIDDGDDSLISAKEVELVAAGVKIESTYPDGQYALFDGTSMAAPQVAGLAAKEWQGSATSTRAYLRSLAEDITSSSGGGAGRGYDVASGYGLPHVTQAAPPPPTEVTAIEVTPASASIGEGDMQQYQATARYSDGSTSDVTRAAIWDSSDDSVAAFKEPGAVKGISQGVTEITASIDGVASNIALLEVKQAPADLTIHIADLDGVAQKSKQWWRPVVVVTIHDSNHNPISRAKVTGKWSLPILSGGDAAPTEKKSVPRDEFERLFGSLACKTNGKGVCRIQGPVILNLFNLFDSMNFEVKSVRHRDMDYNPSDNHDPDSDSDGTLITIAKP